MTEARTQGAILVPLNEVELKVCMTVNFKKHADFL
jgi:hypothetical protein